MSDQSHVDHPGAATEHQATSRFRRVSIRVVTLLLVSAAIFSVYSLCLDKCLFSSIEPEDIVIARVGWNRWPAEPVWFEVPPQTVCDMLAALTPHRNDLMPAKWVVLGELDIKLTNERRCNVQLYDTYEDAAAFSINGWYYRGGTMNGIKGLLQKAYSDATREHP